MSVMVPVGVIMLACLITTARMLASFGAAPEPVPAPVTVR